MHIYNFFEQIELMVRELEVKEDVIHNLANQNYLTPKQAMEFLESVRAEKANYLKVRNSTPIRLAWATGVEGGSA